MNAMQIVSHVAIHVATDQRRMAEELVRNALIDERNNAEPELVELKAEVVRLRKSLAYHYRPTPDECIRWDKHCDEIWSAGGTPPDEDEWRVELALAELERRE
jgi:hypothetical protein